MIFKLNIIDILRLRTSTIQCRDVDVKAIVKVYMDMHSVVTIIEKYDYSNILYVYSYGVALLP